MGLVILCLVAGMVFLLQPSGQMSNFQKWQYQPPEKSSALPTLKVKFFGVSTLLFDDGKTQILIDGFFSRPSLSQVLFQKIKSAWSNPAKGSATALITHTGDFSPSFPLWSCAEYCRAWQTTSKYQNYRFKQYFNIAYGGQVAEQQLIQVPPLHTLSFGEFKVTAMASQHIPLTAVNNDLGEEVSRPLQLPANFSEFKEGHRFDYLIKHQSHKILVKVGTCAVPDQLKNLKVDNLSLGIAQLSHQSKEFQQNYMDQTLKTLKSKVVVPLYWEDFFKPVDQPLEFLPYLANNTNQSLKILIKQLKNRKSHWFYSVSLCRIHLILRYNLGSEDEILNTSAYQGQNV